MSDVRKTDAGVSLLAFQRRVQDWMMECFSMEICRDTMERNHRFIEEALELVQSLGCTKSEVHQLVDYVYDRPAGEPKQEAGGVKVTLAALCLAADLDMDAAGETELARIWTKIDVIRAKQAAKPKHSPLPEHARSAPVPPCEVEPVAAWAASDFDRWLTPHGQPADAAMMWREKSKNDVHATPLYAAPARCKVEPVPVAWQRRNRNNDWLWIENCAPANLDLIQKSGWEIRPLYAAPARCDAAPFYGAQCPSYPACSGGCGLGCTHDVEKRRAAPVSRLDAEISSPPAATTGDIPSGTRPPASAAMGHRAGGEAVGAREALEPFAKLADAYHEAHLERIRNHRDEGRSDPAPLANGHRVSISMGELRRARDAYAALSHLPVTDEAGREKWECMGRKQVLPELGDCNWPDCGCDPHAIKVIESLLEQGWSGPEQKQ